MTIDLLNGREMPVYGRAIVPIVGRYCICQHNHLAKYRYDEEGRYVAYGASAQCSGCDCASFVKASA